MGVNYKGSIPSPDLQYMYPQRFVIGDHFEVWRFPYVKDGILEEEPDIVLVLLNETKNYLHVFTPLPQRTKDLDYLSRITWLVQDISEDFDLECHVIDDWGAWNRAPHIREFEDLAKKFCEE